MFSKELRNEMKCLNKRTDNGLGVENTSRLNFTLKDERTRLRSNVREDKRIVLFSHRLFSTCSPE